MSAAAIFVASVPAHAEAGADYFIETIDGGGSDGLILTAALNGMVLGFSWANAELESANEAPLFCQPRRIALASDQIIDILRRYVESHPDQRQTAAGLVMLMALKDALPC